MDEKDPIHHDAFRENVKRSIFIQGEINSQMVSQLTPRILDLRHASDAPITVYIDSPGGNIRQKDIILNLLTAPLPDRNLCRFTTVVTGMAASAAADLLALGHYAIAYPDTQIHFHGSRQSSADVTVEAADSLANFLRQFNDTIAIRLAQRTFDRIVFLYLIEKDDSAQKKASSTVGLPEVEGFVHRICQHLSPTGCRLALTALKSFREILELSQHVFADLAAKENESTAEVEVNMFKRILDFELKKNSKDGWCLSRGGLDQVVSDFRAFTDFYIGPHNDKVHSMCETYGPYFLTAEETEEHDKLLNQSGEESNTWLRGKTRDRLRPLWYYTVSLCRLLQQRENLISPIEAYWLGLVDEVYGQDLRTVRELVESQHKSESGEAGTSESTTDQTPTE